MQNICPSKLDSLCMIMMNPQLKIRPIRAGKNRCLSTSQSGTIKAIIVVNLVFTIYIFHGLTLFTHTIRVALFYFIENRWFLDSALMKRKCLKISLHLFSCIQLPNFIHSTWPHGLLKRYAADAVPDLMMLIVFKTHTCCKPNAWPPVAFKFVNFVECQMSVLCFFYSDPFGLFNSYCRFGHFYDSGIHVCKCRLW